MNRRLALAALLALALAVRLAFFFGGIRGSDAYLYSEHAWDVATGRYSMLGNTRALGLAPAPSPEQAARDVAPAMAALRFGVVLPTALAYRLFGVGDVQAALFPLLASLGTVIVIARLGALLADEVTGHWAAFLAAVYPLDVQLATLLGPDSFFPLLSGAAVLAFLSGQAACAGGRPARASLLFFGAGVALGIAGTLRETALVLLLPLALMFAWARRPAWAHMLVPAGVVLVLGAEVFAFWLGTGVPTYRLRVAALFESLLAGSPVAITSFLFYPRAMLGLDLAGFARCGIYFLLAAAAIAARAAAAPLVLWLVPVLAVLTFGSVSLTRYVPIVKAHGYLSIVTVPVVLLAALLAARLARLRPRPAWAVALGTVVLVTSLYATSRVLANVRADARPYRLVAAVLTEDPAHPVWVHNARWQLSLNYFLRYDTGYRYVTLDAQPAARLRDLSAIRDPRGIDDAYVVVHARYLAWDAWARPVAWRPEVPRFLVDPPAAWSVVLADRGTPAYNAVTLYRVPPAR